MSHILQQASPSDWSSVTFYFMWSFCKVFQFNNVVLCVVSFEYPSDAVVTREKHNTMMKNKLSRLGTQSWPGEQQDPLLWEVWGAEGGDEIFLVVGVEKPPSWPSLLRLFSPHKVKSVSHIFSQLEFSAWPPHTTQPWLSPTSSSSTSCNYYSVFLMVQLSFYSSGLSSMLETTSLGVPAPLGSSLMSSVSPAATGKKLHRKVNWERLADMSGLILRSQFYSKWTHQCIFQTANHGSE